MLLMAMPIEGLPLLLLIVGFIIWVIALVSLANSRFTETTTKLCWFLIVLSLPVIGVLLFILWGRRELAGSVKNH